MGMGRRRCSVCDELVGEVDYAAHQMTHSRRAFGVPGSDDRAATKPRAPASFSAEEREERRRSESDAEEIARNQARRAATQRALRVLPEINLVIGERVRSSLSGEGQVTEIAEAGPVQRVWVQFDSGRRGKLFARALERI
jgi:hypothetical protein